MIPDAIRRSTNAFELFNNNPVVLPFAISESLHPAGLNDARHASSYVETVY